MIGKEQDVLAPLAERRQMNPEHRDTIVQVFAEPALGDRALEVAVGGGNETAPASFSSADRAHEAALGPYQLASFGAPDLSADSLHVCVWIHTFTCDAARTRPWRGQNPLVRSLPRRRGMSQRDLLGTTVAVH